MALTFTPVSVIIGAARLCSCSYQEEKKKRLEMEKKKCQCVGSEFKVALAEI
jgi:hypothetical protein